MLITPIFLHNYQIPTLINLLLLQLHSQAVSHSTFLTTYVIFESCMRSITWSGRRPGNEAIGTRIIYSESEKAAASTVSMLGIPMKHTAYYV